MGHPQAVTHKPLNYFDEWLSLRFPRRVAPNDRLIVNLYGYFDESGTHKGSAALALAGFVGKADDWGAFSYEWGAALAEWGIDYFHMAPFESRLREYKDWTNEQRQDRLNHLLALIAKYTVASVGVVIPLADYDAIFTEDELPPPPNVEWLAPGIAGPGAPWPGDAPPHEPEPIPGAIRRKSGGPYGLAASVLFRDIAEHVYGLSDDPYVAYTFEAGAEGVGQVVKVFQDNYRDEDTRRDLRLDSIHFEDKRKFPPLQAADILAYELYKHLPRQLGTEQRPSRYTLRELAKRPRSWGWLEADELRKWHYVLGLGLHYSTGTWHK
jgi:Protein of unknown function (DUF3800)